MQVLLQVKYHIYEWYRTNIKHQEDCYNCAYFGGAMCDHLDSKGECLGWLKSNWNIIKSLKYKHQINKTVRLLKKDINKYEKS